MATAYIQSLTAQPGWSEHASLRSRIELSHGLLLSVSFYPFRAPLAKQWICTACTKRPRRSAISHGNLWLNPRSSEQCSKGPYSSSPPRRALPVARFSCGCRRHTFENFSIFDPTRVSFATEGSESSNACLPENNLSSLVPLAKSCEKGIGLGF